MWNSESSTIMFNICLAAANDNETYKTNILKTRDRYLAESITGNYFWGTGLSHTVTKQTITTMYPGENEMRKILMRVREALNNQEFDTDITEQKIEDLIATPVSQLKTDQETTEQEIDTAASQVITDQITTEQASAAPETSSTKTSFYT